ncbi:FAD-dependent oxidoreductase [Cellulophaga baltica]|uniref:NAD(P)/FAD-dependent oxidoreductase n=1 Tax=Cellulophaga TaxID=104264 RepID=UPI001C065F9D|nr:MULTISPECIES: NAD(P)/FAD-dependent oxidoreductase [Cellulophaga]MBU2996917.1 FAD-dependent oxidoreductase [Cellulophaga baltica]MDO6768315.1 NAD(P)/FAD-dependent oxidoreductase [Cellulophaga sp. 1_MG-2023]
MNNHNIYIIGSGVSGLIAAKVLEDYGFSPNILEASSKVGGRVKTDIVSGYQLDRGFQVLLTAYPLAKKYLNIDALNLQKFSPGAVIFNEGKQNILGDPLRETSLLIPTIFSRIGNFSDKIKVLRLNKALKSKTVDEIFKEKEKTTLAYLIDFGFSSQMIDCFFKPFFSGIFLESNLNTSSRMFEFIYKMFGEGYAALPKSGIQAIPNQIAESLNRTNIQFNSVVNSVKDGHITLKNGNELESDFTIVATKASSLISNLKNQAIKWKSCDTLYFETEHRVVEKPLIGLIPNPKALINNIFYNTSLKTDSSATKELLSVTIVKKHNLTEEELIFEIKKELDDYCGISSCKFLKRYNIPFALPDLDSVEYDIEPSETQLTSRIFLAGDMQLNGSLNAAMLSGEKAALAVVNAINEN